MSVLNQASDGQFNVLIALVRASVRFGPRERAELLADQIAREHRLYALERARPGHVDTPDVCRRVRGSEQPRNEQDLCAKCKLAADRWTPVADRLWAERSEVKQAFRDGAIVFVCGDGLRMAPAVRQTLIDIYREETGDTEGAAEAWADAMERDHGRYVADVFA